MVIEGKKIAEEVLNGLRRLPKPKKFLAGVLIGQDPASESFQKLKQKTAESLGLDYRIYHLAEAISQDAAREKVGEIARHQTCGGILVQLPLPPSLNRHYVLNAIPREKDVDVIGERALGAFYAGRNAVLPPAVGALQEILNRVEFDLGGKKVAVVGPGFLVGRPIAVWLMDKVAEVYILDKGSDYAVLRRADLVISGAGVANLINPEMLKEGAGVIDFSYSQNKSGDLVGDFNSSLLASDTRLTPLFYTPTPGGTGPILVAKLMENFYTLNATP